MALTVVLMLGSCVAAGAAGTAAVSSSGKLPYDHVYSWITGKDCSHLRTVQGKTYCREDEPELASTAHCYSTLGEVTCYDRPFPYPGNKTEVESVPPHPAN